MDRTKKAETAGYHSSLRFLSEIAYGSNRRSQNKFYVQKNGEDKNGNNFIPENVRPTFDGKPEADVNLIGENSLDEDSNRFSYLAGWKKNPILQDVF